MKDMERFYMEENEDLEVDLNNEKDVAMLPCAHKYDKECILKWFKDENNWSHNA